ncbi:hypothetical protein GWI33_010387 [Rhynchophorus ferrugineus]|uniref:Uncharacterized protein n=1 Tax=Rhynchophorus ferrugineus TaxID=354439 RepID=A0A834IXB6_RHYFE|nr:hypothetical protein GWI33_010387 [Rhynchophorus ferrugineus]
MCEKLRMFFDFRSCGTNFIKSAVINSCPTSARTHPEQERTAPRPANRSVYYRVGSTTAALTETVVNVQEAPNNNAPPSKGPAADQPLAWININVDYFKTTPGLLKVAEFAGSLLTKQNQVSGHFAATRSPADWRARKRGISTICTGCLRITGA